MKRNLFCTLLALALALSLASCGGQDNPGNTGSGAQSNAPGSSGQTNPSGQTVQPGGADVKEYVFLAGDVKVAVNDNMAGVLEALGEPQSYFEAESCASGFSITTRQEGEEDFVNSILLTDDSVTTPEGIYLGSSGSDVIAAYGESQDGFETLLIYTKNGATLNFVLSEDKVVSIEYLAE